MTEPLLYETHSHTPLCNHAVGEPEEYARAAASRGLRGLTVTCHNPMPAGFSARVRMRPEEIDDYVAMVDRARNKWEGTVDVRLGLEADYFEGYESWLEWQLGAHPYHYVLGSVHPQIEEFRERYWEPDQREVQKTYFRLLAQAAESGLFDSLAHPDLIKNVTPDQWEPDELMETICTALDRIAATGTAMELNTSGLNKTIPEMNPFPAMLVEMCKRDIPVVIGADAHEPQRVADRFEEAMDLLTECGYRHIHFFLNRQRQRVAIDEAKASLRQPQGFLARQGSS